MKLHLHSPQNEIFNGRWKSFAIRKTGPPEPNARGD